MAIYWPTDLPLSIQYGASSKYGQGNKVITDMDYGPKKVRRRFTNTAMYQTVNLRLSDNQLDQFLAFYYGEINEGYSSFYANVIAQSGIEQKRVTIINDSLEIRHTDYNSHEIELQLEIYNPIGYQGDKGLLWLLGIYGPDFVETELADPIDVVVNVTYPAIT